MTKERDNSLNAVGKDEKYSYVPWLPDKCANHWTSLFHKATALNSLCALKVHITSLKL